MLFRKFSFFCWLFLSVFVVAVSVLFPSFVCATLLPLKSIGY